MKDAPDAAQIALAKRLEAEVTQAGGQASTVSRDKALANLVNQPSPRGKAAKMPMPSPQQLLAMRKSMTPTQFRDFLGALRAAYPK